MPVSPYHEDLGTREPLEAMADTPGRIHALVSRMTDAQLASSYAPGKWTATQLLVHLAQAELAMTTRLRMALTQPGYVAQPYDQDRWLELEGGTHAAAALGAYIALRQMNLQLFRRLTAARRAAAFTHPEHGEVTVEWLLETIAGHELHHLPQIEAIARAQR